MKAVCGPGDGVAVVDVDEPPGSASCSECRSTSVCGSDLMYIGFGTRKILGHELAGRPGGRHAGGGRGDLRLHGVRPVPARHVQPLPDARRSGRSASRPTAAWPSSSGPRPTGSSAARRARRARRLDRRARPVSWHALAAGRHRARTAVAIVGAGALGLLAGRRRPPHGRRGGRVEARHPHQHEAAERLGARVGTDGLYDVVVEAAGTAESLARAVELVAPRRHGRRARRPPRHGRGQLDAAVPPRGQLLPSLGYCAHDGSREMEDAATMLADGPGDRPRP